jgi:hypothetical protein
MTVTLTFAAGLVAGALGGAPSWPAPQEHSHGDPSDDEQYVLEVINRARADPFSEGARLGVDPREGLTPAEAARVGRRPPLAFNADLQAAARAHTRDMFARNFFDHANPDGNDVGARAEIEGYFWHRIAENIAAGSSLAVHTAAHLQDLLFIDATVDGRGHRTNLLDVSGAALPPPPFREIGIGFEAFPEPNGMGFRTFLTQEFGRRTDGPFLVGLVMDDANGNDAYDPGEGVRGIRVHHDRGPFWGVTSASGGYACPVDTQGVVTVMPSGGGIAWAPSVAKKAYLEGENVKVDFRTSEAADSDGDGMPDAWEVRHGFDPSSAADAGDDADGDRRSNLEEFQFGTAPHDARSFPGAPAPPPPPDANDRDDSARGCGLTGLDLLLLVLGPLALLRKRRAADRSDE